MSPPPHELFILGFDADGEVEVVGEQAIGVGESDRFDVFCVELEKIKIVALFAKDGLSIVAAMVDVVVAAGKQAGCSGHGVAVVETFKVWPDLESL